MYKGVFLDRDGVINEERNTYTYRREDFRILPGVREAVSRLHEAGFLLVVITNQGGISKGLYTRAEVDLCHQYMQECLGGLIRDILYSPYHPDQTRSLSRKPSPYLFERAMALYQIDRAKSWAVGDQLRDIEAARSAGIRSIAVGEEASELGADLCAEHLLAATQLILSTS